MKNLLSALFAFVLLSNILSAQNPAWILAPNYIPTVGGSLATPLPSFPGGYDGITPASSSQNILVDNQGQIVFFMVDEKIYGRNGELIDVFNSNVYYPYPQGFYTEAQVKGLVSEVTIVPIPGKCNTYLLVSSVAFPSITFAAGVFGTLVVEYDDFGNLMPGSGLTLPQPSELADPCDKASALSNLIGPNYFSNNISHDEAPTFAAVPKSNGQDFFVFVRNGSNIFRLSVDNSGVNYDNYFLNLHQNNLIPGVLTIPAPSDRTALEVIQMDNGNYRLATPVNFSTNIPGQEKHCSVVVLDFDPNGDFIPGTLKIADYPNESSFTIPKLEFHGIELTKNGERLFVSHNKSASTTSTLDVFDLSGATPVKTILSSDLSYQYSAIEAALDAPSGNDAVYIATNDGLDKIAFASSNNTISNNAIPLGAYPTSDPYNTNLPHTNVILLQDQIDYWDYSNIDTKIYHADVYEVTGNEVWSPGTTPIINGSGTTAYIKKELRIKEGASLTINGLDIFFHPDARVVVENATSVLQGGKLTLNDTKFDVDDRCLADRLWFGLEVWGNANQNQGSMSFSNQGRLYMTNNSQISNAHEGILLGRRNTISQDVLIAQGDCQSNTAYFGTVEIVQLNDYNYTNSGGLVQAYNSKVYNCPRSVHYLPYNPSNYGHFENITFQWSGPMLENAEPASHVLLQTIKPLTFVACTFENLTPDLYSTSSNLEGNGILSFQSQFTVRSACNAVIPMGQLCPSPGVPSEFNNLRFGIYSFSISGTRTFVSDANLFDNNRFGIYVVSTDMEMITRNTFRVRKSDQYQTAGLAMYGSSGYKVEDNEFYQTEPLPLIPNANALTYGIVVNNSGETYNEIYRNRFHDLLIGGQTERINGIVLDQNNNTGNGATFSANGLKWLCNDFQSEVYKADLTLFNGRFNYLQTGYSGSGSPLQVAMSAARNKFSLQNEPQNLDHDLFLYYGQEFRYDWVAAPRNKPDSYTSTGSPLYFNNVIPTEKLYNQQSVTDDTYACPSKLIFKTKPLLLAEMDEVQMKITEVKNLLNEANYAYLSDLIETSTDQGYIKNELLEKSPYLPDATLIAYIQSNPPSGLLMQVILANSPLNQSVLAALQASNYPIGVLNQIAAVQGGDSPKLLLSFALSSYISYWEELYNDLTRSYLLDNETRGDYDGLKNYLEVADSSLTGKKLLLETCLEKDDLQRADDLLTEILPLNPELCYMEIMQAERNLNNYYSELEGMQQDSSIRANVETVEINYPETKAHFRAKALLKLTDGIGNIPDFLLGANAMMIQSVEQEAMSPINLYQALSVNVYPNPSTGVVYFDYPDKKSGDMSIEIYSLEGKLMFQKQIIDSNGERIDLSSLKKGFYLAKVLFDGLMVHVVKLELF